MKVISSTVIVLAGVYLWQFSSSETGDRQFMTALMGFILIFTGFIAWLIDKGTSPQ